MYSKIEGVTYALGTHKRTVLSFDPEASMSPSGENCTEVTTPYITYKIRYMRSI